MLRAAYEKYRRDGLISVLAATVRKLYEEYWLLKLRAGGQQLEYRGVSLDLSNPYIDRNLRLRFLHDNHEWEEAELVDTHLPPSLDTIELGAGIGFLSCYIDARLEPEATQLAVEAHDGLIPTLRGNKDRNDGDFKMVHGAYSPAADEVKFHVDRDFRSGSLVRHADADNRVETITIDATDVQQLASEYGLSEFALVVDIEGGEYELLAAELEFLAAYCRLLVVEFHDRAGRDIEATIDSLDDGSFTLVERRNVVCVFERE